jgi:hypothetical protein
MLQDLPVSIADLYKGRGHHYGARDAPTRDHVNPWRCWNALWVGVFDPNKGGMHFSFNTCSGFIRTPEYTS